MKTHGGRAWIDHIAGVLAQAKHGTTAPIPVAHQHGFGIARCPACQAVRRTCGNPDCTICEEAQR